MKFATPNPVDRLSLHDHACLIYETPAEQFSVAVPFLSQGLDRGEYCGYIVDDNSIPAVVNAFAQHHVPISEEIERGHFVMMTKRETYFRDGAFTPDKMLAFVRSAVQEARGKGFPGARFTGEMTWHLGSDVTPRELLVYEAKLNYVLREEPLAGICQYNLNRFAPDVLLGILHTHPIVIYKNIVAKNHYYIPPDEYLAEEENQRTKIERHLANIVERERTALEMRKVISELETAKSTLVGKISELESFQEAVVGRELKMMALEKENQKLRDKPGV